MVSEPREIKALFDSLPEGQKKPNRPKECGQVWVIFHNRCYATLAARHCIYWTHSGSDFSRGAGIRLWRREDLLSCSRVLHAPRMSLWPKTPYCFHPEY